MIRIREAGDINWVNLYRVAYQGAELEIDAALLAKVDAARTDFLALIERGVPCYGVTTGLGKLAEQTLDEAAREQMAQHILLGRAAAIGPPFPQPVARAMLLIRLVNFLTGLDGVSSKLCCYLVDRLNDDFTPWIPSLGHGMAADTTANSHAFQTLIGAGSVFGPDGERQTARAALEQRGAAVLQLSDKEGIALINGVCAAPALAMHAFYQLDELLSLANLVAAVSLEGLAAPKDSLDAGLGKLSSEPGVGKIITAMRKHLNHSQVTAFKLQAPISYRVIPQVHGALFDALTLLRQKIENSLVDFSGNPVMLGENLLSVGLFHNQHLVNQVEQVALALAHLGALSERRLHRLMNNEFTGLPAQLASRPGLDAGLVVVHKASIDLAARLRQQAQPLSLFTAESSSGQEDYMSLAVPAILRLGDMAELVRAMLAYELLAGIIAVRMRPQKAGDSVVTLLDYYQASIASFDSDRSPGADVESILQGFDSETVKALLR